MNYDYHKKVFKPIVEVEIVLYY